MYCKCTKFTYIEGQITLSLNIRTVLIELYYSNVAYIEVHNTLSINIRTVLIEYYCTDVSHIEGQSGGLHNGAHQVYIRCKQ